MRRRRLAIQLVNELVDLFFVALIAYALKLRMLLMLAQQRATIYSFTQIRVAAGNVDLICTGEIVQHRHRSATGIFSCSALHPE